MNQGSLKIMKGLVLTVLFMLAAPKAHAYVDLGLVNYAAQVVIALIVGGIFAIKIYWLKIKAGVQRLFSSKKAGRK